MAPLARLWNIVTTTIYTWTVSSLTEYGMQQRPVGNNHHGSEVVLSTDPGYPVLDPPGSNIHDFQCVYPDMPGWTSCQSDTDKSCWIISPDGKSRFDINTNYEAVAPTGIDRYYYLNVTDVSFNADGLFFPEAKLFNNSLPGPLIEACWGDRVHIKVTNLLKNNGTSVHWHGIRQNHTMPMDGVNGVTQCPIAPGDSMWYNWTVTQYGSSWYHSHYSVQYADGVAAPITLHGPTSANFDEGIKPLIITDWSHNSAFEVEYTFNRLYKSILLDGRGNITRYNGTTQTDGIPPGFEMTFNKTAPNPATGARRYLLRLINTAFDTGFVFSIDNHYLQVVETDFVPITPYTTTSVLIAIGQRYHVIVEANPQSTGSANPVPPEPNFWIRTWVAANCSNGDEGIAGYERTGILRYDESATSTADPESLSWPGISLACVDESYGDLHPVVPWTVGQAANNVDGTYEEFNVTRKLSEQQFATAFLSFERPLSNSVTPFQTDYGNPTFLNMGNEPTNWPVGWVVIPEDYSPSDWIYLAINVGLNGNNTNPHPIHLHGHDFAILNVSSTHFSPASTILNLSNPPRRDVVLLPNNGSIVIAFPPDNPGVWLVHCHIAFHASGGLAMQVLERQEAANALWPPGRSAALTDAQRVCGNWNSWAYDCRNYWPGAQTVNGRVVYPACRKATELQNDSGV